MPRLPGRRPDRNSETAIHMCIIRPNYRRVNSLRTTTREGCKPRECLRLPRFHAEPEKALPPDRVRPANSAPAQLYTLAEEISRILNRMVPRGTEISTVSPFLRPISPCPIGLL